ncbi:hypothetical protein [Rheinheimera sp.]|uniref:hypothetical protein n=1 Tax=Rheinheimera sp. TaxID=1869214 RepID=UPI003D2B90A5
MTQLAGYIGCLLLLFACGVSARSEVMHIGTVMQQMTGLKVQAVQPALEQMPMYHYIHQKHQALVGPLTAQFEKS